MNNEILVNVPTIMEDHSTTIKIFIIMVAISVLFYVSLFCFKKLNERYRKGYVDCTVFIIAVPFLIALFGLSFLAISSPTPDNSATTKSLVEEVTKKTGVTVLSTSPLIKEDFVDNYSDYNGGKNSENSDFWVRVSSKNNKNAYCYMEPAEISKNDDDRNPKDIRMVVKCTDNSKTTKLKD